MCKIPGTKQQEKKKVSVAINLEMGANIIREYTQHEESIINELRLEARIELINVGYWNQQFSFSCKCHKKGW